MLVTIVPDPVVVAQPADVTEENGKREKEGKSSVGDPEDELEKAYPEANPVAWDIVGKTSWKRDRKALKRNAWHAKPEDNGFSHMGPTSHKKNQMLSAFKSKAFVSTKQAWEPHPNDDPREDYTEVFLCHARLYVFSDQFEIESLMRLTLQKLRLTLSRFSLYQERVPDIVSVGNQVN